MQPLHQLKKMAPNTYEFFVLGSTGLCGGSFVKYLNKYIETTSPGSTLNAIIRKPYEETYLKKYELGKGENVNTLVEEDSSKWANETLKNFSSKSGELSKIFFSGLGTTKATAGSIEKQRKIDLDLNYALAKAAKDQGFETYVLVSSAGANSNSMFAYLKMKGELEDKLKDLKFENLIILRPGALLGDRITHLKGFGSDAASYIGSMLYGTRFSKYVGEPVYGDEVGKAGVKLALKAVAAKEPSGAMAYSSKEIINLAKD